MVRVTSILARIPVIKFRKGGKTGPSTAPAQAVSSPPSAAPSAPSAQGQSAAGMSTCVPDIDLPIRYRRAPISEEEINHINGGGIV